MAVKLVLATTNEGKVREFRRIFEGEEKLNWLLPGQLCLPSVSVPEVVEDGRTFAENARKKAVAYAKATGCFALADDSGLEVEGLAGAPGVRSKRYGGEDASDEENIAKLLGELRPGLSRSARFVAVLALASPEGALLLSVRGACEGQIAHKVRGANGFGYDPVFVPAGFEQTMAELGPEEKDALSHRGRAVAALAGELQQKVDAGDEVARRLVSGVFAPS